MKILHRWKALSRCNVWNDGVYQVVEWHVVGSWVLLGLLLDVWLVIVTSSARGCECKSVKRSYWFSRPSRDRAPSG
jgi:hypothetical protein